MKLSRTNKVVGLTEHFLTLLQVKEKGVVLIKQEKVDGGDDAQISKKLAAMVKSFKVTPQGFTAVVRRQDALVRYLCLPAKDLVEVRSMAALQVQDLVPYTAEDVVFDVVKLTDNASGSNKVMVVIVPRETIERQWTVMSNAGIVPLKVTISSFGLFAWLKSKLSKEEGTSLLVDLDGADGEICVCSSTHLLASRAVRFETAGDTPEFTKTLIKEITLTVDAFSKDVGGALPSRVVLTSSMPLSLEVLAALKKEFDVPVEDVDTSRTLPRTESSALNLYGASLLNSGEGVDLVPRALVEAQRRVELSRAFSKLAIAAVFFVIVLSVAACLYVQRKNSYLTRLESEWVKTKKELDKFQKAQERIDALKEALQGRVIVADVLNAVTNAAPEGIALFNLNLGNDKILSMQGVARDQNDISNFQDGLNRSGMFNNVRLDFVNKRTTADSEMSYFKLSCQLK